jgi:DNA polymerase-3 subunit delta'
MCPAHPLQRPAVSPSEACQSVIRSSPATNMPFREVIGHRRLVHLLARAIEKNSLPPSLIFAGPDGIGKRSVAVAAAQALNCTSPSVAADGGGDACGTCAACDRIARGIHPDVLIVEPGENGSIKVDQIREIIDRAAYRPFEGRRRVVIVDGADTLLAGAQNALLKTLEEPPPSSVFILVTARPDMLLATVRSRCPRLQFRPLGADVIASALVARGLSEAEAHATAVAAQGSLGRALQVDASELAGARDVATQVLGRVAAEADPRRRIASAKELVAGKTAGSTDREQLATRLQAMASLIRDIELIGVGGDRQGLANPDVSAEIERLGTFAGERGVHAYAAVDKALWALRRNAAVKVVADWVVLQL